MAKALAAADVLSEEGTSAEVIDLRTLSPLDVATCVASAKKTGRVVVVDEAPKIAGPGAEIAASVQELAFEYLDAPVGRLGAKQTTMPESPPLLDHVLPSVSDVVEAVRRSFAAFEDGAD